MLMYASDADGQIYKHSSQEVPTIVELQSLLAHMRLQRIHSIRQGRQLERHGCDDSAGNWGWEPDEGLLLLLRIAGGMLRAG